MYICFVDRCLSFCTFFFSPLCCPFFFDVRFLIASLISSSSSYSNQKLSYEKLDHVFLQILLFSTVSFMFLVYNQLSILSVLPLNLSSAVYSAGSIPSNHS
jgi:putative effector of murein hydrolase